MPLTTSVRPATLQSKIIAAAAVAVAGTMLAATLPAPDAQAWGNGGDKRTKNGYQNEYGTHDWLVDQAYVLAGRPGWFSAATAVFASGRPDVDWARPTEHVMMETGNGRGAAEQAAEWYVRSVREYRAGDTKKASEYFGYMSHYYADATQPFHAKFDRSSAKRWHRPYEVGTSAIMGQASSVPDYCRRVDVPVADVRTMTIQAAAFARGQFAPLVRALEKYSVNDSARMVRDNTVEAITRKTLSWACSGLAVLLRSIPAAAAMPRAVDRVSVRLVRTKVRVGQKPKIDVKAYDSAGRAMDGVEFRVDWPGTRNDARYYTLPGNGAPKRTRGPVASTRSKASYVRVTVSNPGGTAPVAASGSALAEVTVAKKYRQLTRAQLVKARKKAQKAGRPWRP